MKIPELSQNQKQFIQLILCENTKEEICNFMKIDTQTYYELLCQTEKIIDEINYQYNK